MNEETPTTAKPLEPSDQPIDSKIGNVSVRSIIALLIVATVCGVYFGAACVDVIVSFRKQVAPTFAIPEPIYGGFMLILGAYIGKALEKARKP